MDPKPSQVAVVDALTSLAQSFDEFLLLLALRRSRLLAVDRCIPGINAMFKEAGRRQRNMMQ